MQPEQALLVMGAAAFGTFVVSALTSHRNVAKYSVFGGCAIVFLALAYRWYDTGRAPWAALYETAALLALITGLAAAIVYRRNAPTPFSVALAGASALLLLFSASLWGPGTALPGELDSGWLYVHVPVVIVAYGLFAVSAMAATAYIYLKLKGKGKETLDRLDRIGCRSALAGLALLIAGTALGALWARGAWGAYWTWDPKETWALITIGIYSLYAFLRWRGMRGEDAAYLSILGFLCVLFTYVGVSYLIPGQHSYA